MTNRRVCRIELNFEVFFLNRQTTNASEDDPIFARTNTKADTTAVRADIKTFVFSATLSKDLQGNLKRGSWRKSKKAGNSGNTLDDLITKLDFRDPKPEVIDISPEGRLVATLRESMVECMTLEKVSFFLGSALEICSS